MQTATAAQSAASVPLTTQDAASPLPNEQARLRGRAFYESIGSPKFVLAPMVDQSEFVLHSSLRFSGIVTDISPGVAHAHQIIHGRTFRQEPPCVHSHVPCPNVWRNCQIPR